MCWVFPRLRGCRIDISEIPSRRGVTRGLFIGAFYFRACLSSYILFRQFLWYPSSSRSCRNCTAAWCGSSGDTSQYGSHPPIFALECWIHFVSIIAAVISSIVSPMTAPLGPSITWSSSLKHHLYWRHIVRATSVRLFGLIVPIR